MLESPRKTLERLKQQDPAFAEALDLVISQFDGEVTRVNRKPLR